MDREGADREQREHWEELFADHLTRPDPAPDHMSSESSGTAGPGAGSQEGAEQRDAEAEPGPGEAELRTDASDGGEAGVGAVGSGPVAAAVAALEALGLDAQAAAEWVGVACGEVTAAGTEAPGVPVPASDGQVLGVVDAMARASARLEASLLVWVQDLVISTGAHLLAQRDVSDPGAMSKTAHRTWRVNVKSAVAGELQALLGLSLYQARQLVAIATYPGIVRTPILEALRRGEVVRGLVLDFQRETRGLSVEQAARVAAALFGTDPDTAAVERLDEDGDLALGRPWQHREYAAALEREVTRAKAEDEDAAAKDREAALGARDVQVMFHDDGTARFTWTTSAITAIALRARLDQMARRARAGGDQRSLAQLRSDCLAVLGLYGQVTLPGDAHPCTCTCTTNASDSCAGPSPATDTTGTTAGAAGAANAAGAGAAGSRGRGRRGQRGGRGRGG